MRRLLLMAVLLAGDLLPGVIRALETTTPTPLPALGPEYQELRLVATDHAFTITGQTTAGFTLVTLVNDGQEAHHAQLMHLPEGQTFEELQAAMGQSPEAILDLGRFVGGPSAVAPGGQTQVILHLAAGRYVALCFIESPDGVRHLAKGMVQSFEVTASATSNAAAEPKSTGTVTMRDMAFSLPAEIAPGPQLWEIVNKGPQPHEFALLKLAPGLTPEQAVRILAAPPPSPEATHVGTPAADGPPPFTPVGGTTALAAGLRAWAVLDLASGEYLALCFVPDAATGKPHAALGMVAPFTVG
jgi:hypothetical protein